MGTEGVIGAICGNAVEGVVHIALLQRIKACQIGESCLVGNAKSTKVDAHRISKALLEKPNAETDESARSNLSNPSKS